jgi:hypothetical protein
MVTCQIHVRAFRNKGGKRRISNSGGVFPERLRNGQEHFFKEISTSPIMVASYKAKLEVVFVGSSELETSGCVIQA